MSVYSIAFLAASNILSPTTTGGYAHSDFNKNYAKNAFVTCAERLVFSTAHALQLLDVPSWFPNSVSGILSLCALHLLSGVTTAFRHDA